jgi:hypothetical protein
VVRVEWVALGVGQYDVRGELADYASQLVNHLLAHPQRVVAEVHANELRSDRRRRCLRLRVAHLLDVLDRLAWLVPEVSGLPPLAVGERYHLGLAAPGGRRSDRFRRAPNEIARVGAYYQEPTGDVSVPGLAHERLPRTRRHGVAPKAKPPCPSRAPLRRTARPPDFPRRLSTPVSNARLPLPSQKLPQHIASS